LHLSVVGWPIDGAGDELQMGTGGLLSESYFPTFEHVHGITESPNADPTRNGGQPRGNRSVDDRPAGGEIAHATRRSGSVRPLSQNKAGATPNSYWNGRLDKAFSPAGATQAWRDNYDNPGKSNNGRRAACRRNHASDGAKRSRDRWRTAGCGWSGGQPCCARTARTGRDSGSASPVSGSRDQNPHRASSHVHVGAPQNAKNRPATAVGLLSI